MSEIDSLIEEQKRLEQEQPETELTETPREDILDSSMDEAEMAVEATAQAIEPQ